MVKQRQEEAENDVEAKALHKHSSSSEQVTKDATLETREEPQPLSTPSLLGRDLRLFFHEEIIKGKCLGHGTFGDVYEVESFRPQDNENFSEDQQDARKYYASETKTKYAIKVLKESFESPRLFRLACKDIETEADLLGSLNHSHIIKLYATSASATKASKCSEDQGSDFFLVEDRLSKTLNDAIKQWKRDRSRLPEPPLFRLSSHSKADVKKEQFLAERLRVAYHVASALAYLHSNRIIYRDLKADNVGFDVVGKTKLFDFGLSRKLPSEEKQLENETYQMTGKTGSLPFMAPEVWKKEPYGTKVDVYSFAILLWVMVALDLPYLEMAHDLPTLTRRVFLKGNRPPIHSKWPRELQSLLNAAWSANVLERPTMEQVCKILKRVLELKPSPVTKKQQPQRRPPTTRRSSFL